MLARFSPVLVVLCAGCESTPPPSDALLPTAFAGQIRECGAGGIFPGVEPAVWASAPDALVLGRIEDVRMFDGPFARFLCGASSADPDPVRAECDGLIEHGLQITLEEGAEVLVGEDVGRTFHLGRDTVIALDPFPVPGPLGSVDWTTYGDAPGRIEPGQVILMPAWRHGVLDIVGPFVQALALVDKDGIVRVQQETQPECEWLVPADIDGRPFAEVRELLVREPTDTELVDRFRRERDGAVEFGQDAYWGSMCFPTGGCPQP